MLAPLPPGAHTIHFVAGIVPYGFSLDVTYHVNVSNGSSLATAPVSPDVSHAGPQATGGVPANSTWGKLKSDYR
jgi:hypothetical protein